MSKISENAVESLAILYLEKQDLSGKTPEELYHLYVEIFNRIKAENDNSNPPKPAKAEIISRLF